MSANMFRRDANTYYNANTRFSDLLRAIREASAKVATDNPTAHEHAHAKAMRAAKFRKGK